MRQNPVSFFALLLLSSSLCTNAFAWSQFSYVEDPLSGVVNFSNIIAADAPFPITRYKKGDWKLTAKPVYFTVSRLAYSTDGAGMSYYGDDLNGSGGSVAYSQALTGRWLVYGLFTAATMQGKANGRFGGDFTGGYMSLPQITVDQMVVDGKNSVYNFNAGIGYDLIDGGRESEWSVPVLFGLFLQSYESDMTMIPNLNAPSAYRQNQELEFSGNGTLLGVSFEIGASQMLGKNFEIVPFAIIAATLASPELTYVITKDGGSTSGGMVGQTETDEIGNNIFPMMGLDLTYHPLGLTISLGGLLTSYVSQPFSNGLKLTRFSISKSFGNYAH